MLKKLRDEIVSALCGKGVNAVAAFSSAPLDRAKTTVAVEVKSALVQASGLGNYMGTVNTDGVFRESYGVSSALKLQLSVYSPVPEPDEASGKLLGAMFDFENLRIKSVETEKCEFDTKTGLFKTVLTAQASALLVRRVGGRQLDDYTLEVHDGG